MENDAASKQIIGGINGMEYDWDDEEMHMDKRSRPQSHNGIEKRRVIVLDFYFVCLFVHRQVALVEGEIRMKKLKRNWNIFFE